MNCCDKAGLAVNVVARVATGAVKAAKAIIGLGIAPAGEIDRRRDICRACEMARPCTSDPAKKCWCGSLIAAANGSTRECGCALVLKTRLASEKCPQGKWGPIER